jgi:hypothetical protein
VKDQETAGHSDGQPGDVEERVSFAFAQVAESNFGVVEKHG